MSHRRLSLRALLPLILLVASIPAAADITNASLEIQGIGLTVVTPDPPTTTGIDLPTTVQTRFGGKENDEALAIEGLLAVGDLTGPGLETPLELSTAPGHKFDIPGLSREGIYTLQNIRLMKGRELLQYATPSAATIVVADLFKTSVEVRQLSPEEIRARGIVIDPRNFEVYEYTLSFIFRGETVKIPFPVIIDPRTRQVQAMPIIDPYSLPPIATIGAGRWTPPDIVTVEFEQEELPEEERNAPKEAKEPGEKVYTRPPIPAAIVIPNSLAVMHQFFAVILTVQNGAPNGSTAKLENVTARIKVPSQLRTASSKPAVSLGQAVPIVDKVNGLTILVAQAKAEAEWSVEALKPGTHTIEIELRGTLKENGQEDVPLIARPRASVVVHDARFNIAFSHPDVVRKGIEYTTYSFVTNVSPATQTIRLGNSVPPCATAGSTANVCRIGGELSDEVTIPSGETRTIEYRLRSGITGKVFATAAHIESENAVATAQLHMGVSDTGIPLSPTTLIMPHYAQYVSESLVSEYLQILGLGYSLATAPVTAATAKLPRVIKTDVYRRAVDIAQAGQAIFLSNDNREAKRDALAALSVDLLGNNAELSQWDALRRLEKYARPAGAAVTRELEAAGLANNTSFETFVDDFGKALSHRDGYVAALVHGPETTATARPYALSVRGVTSGRRMDVPAEAESGWVRDLPYGELTKISAPAIGRMGELALVGRWTTEDLEVVVTPSVNGLVRLELLYPNTTDGSTMRAHLEFNGVAGEPIRVPLTRGATSVNALMINGAFADTAPSSVIALEALRVVGMRQDLYLDENGHKVSILFNRPVAGGVPAANLREKFHGEIDFNKDGVVFMDEPRPISAAALQESGRVIDLTFDHVLTTNADYSIEIDPLVDPRTTLAASFPGEHTPKLDNDRPAGIIYGRFVRGDNTPLGNHEVILFSGIPNGELGGLIFEEFENPRRRVPINPYIQPPQIATTRADGTYLFEFVRRDLEAGFDGLFRLWGLADGLTKYTFVDGAVRLPGRVHFVNLQLLGRGSAEGTVRFDNGEIAKNANVTVGSTAFEGVRSTTTNDAGFYRVEDLPVGPLTFTATDGHGNIGYAAGEIATPGEIELQDISIYRQPVPKNGSVHGIIRRSDTGGPVAGASVGVFNNGYQLASQTTDSEGRYNFEKVPAGFISIVAAEWTISRQSANTDFDLRGDEVRQVDLTLSIVPNEQLATVTGQVLREDPLFPGNASKYQPVANALVLIAGMKIITADANGHFEYVNVPLSRSGYDIGAHDPVTRRTEHTTLPQLTAAGPNNVPILLKGLGKGKVRAKLLNARGLPVSGYEMLVKQGGAYYGMTDIGDGVYELGNLDVGGDYIVRTGAAPSEYGFQEVSAPSVRVAFDKQVVSVTLRLPGQGDVHARVKGISLPTDGSEPILTSLISEVTLSFMYFNSTTLQNDIHEVTLSTNQGGLPGDAIFTAIPALKDYDVVSQHPLGHSGANGRLAFEGDLGDHTLLLSNLGHVMGVVYAIDGVTPVPGAQVRLDDGHQDQGIVLTGLDGRFEFRNVAPGTQIHLIAESTQAGIYRIGERYGSVPDNGGVVTANVTLLERGQIEGRVVYAAYKVYDPLHPENNVVDNTPNDPSDNAPVPMARLYMRELDFPRRDLGTPLQPLSADLAGRFAIDNVFVGRLRATSWAVDNPDLRGDWTATLTREGELLTPYIKIGGGGTGAMVVTVTNPNQQNAPVENAEVQLFRDGLFDLASTNANGQVRFEQLPVGSYVAVAYSKALGKSGRAPDSIVVRTEEVAEARVMLTFSGEVTGRLTDPEAGNAPVPGSHVTMSMAEGFQQRFTTTALGEYLFEGVREGIFTIDAKDTASNRRARATYLLSAADPAPVVNLELERTESLYVSVYLPDDFGGNSGVLAGPVEATVSQRQGEFFRAQQGNPIVMPKLFLKEAWNLHTEELGGERRTYDTFGSFPKGSATQPIQIVYPAYGALEVLVRRNNAAVPDARVSVRVSKYDTRVFYSDEAGRILATGLPLNRTYSITATTLDGSSGAGSVEVLRTSVLASKTIEVGARATVSGKVLAENGSPSIGTVVVIRFSGGQLTATTDEQGAFTFAGVATTPGASAADLTYYGEDGSTVGAYQSFPLGNEWAGREYIAPTVRIDATPPLLLDISPEQGANTVPPDTHLKFVFSERIDSSNVNNDTFTLQPADGSPRVNATFTSAAGANGTWVVTMVPPAAPAGQQFPLKSNTLYRLTVSQYVRDMTGHPLGTNRGLTFTTADYVEPRVISTVPAAGEPIPEQITYEFRFNEPLDPAPFAPNGTGKVELARMSGPEDTATVEELIPGDAYIDPFTGISLFFAPSMVTKANSFYRIKFSGVRDLQGNVVPEKIYRLASFDTFKPFVILESPVPNGGALVSGLTYTLTPDVRNATADGTPAQDVDRVEYFRVEDGKDTFIKAIRKAPFAYEFVAPDAPVAGLALVFKAKAFDKSTNESDMVTLSLTVKPNQPPTVSVALDRTTNVFAGERVNATVTTTDEVLDINLQLDVKATRTDNTEYRKVYPATVHRNSLTDPWPTSSFAVDLPTNLKGATVMTFTGIATDMSGLGATNTASLTLAVDTVAPTIVATTPEPWTELSFGNTYKLSATVTDVGTGVSEVVFNVDGQTLRVARAAAVNNVYTTPAISVTAHSVNTTVPVTITAIDVSGNQTPQTFNVVYLAVDDPTVPTAEWLCPITGAVLPANTSNLQLNLRLHALDDVSVTSVRFRMPDDSLVVPTQTGDEYAATVTINTPGPEKTDYIITAVVSDADPAHTQEYRLRLAFVTPDFTINATQAIIASDVATYQDKTIVVTGAQGRLVPHVPVRLKNLIVIGGGRVDTLATTTTVERKLELTVTGTMYVDCASSIDLTGRGYLPAYGPNTDGSGTRNESDHGRTFGNTIEGGAHSAGGSHAGIGGTYVTGVTNAPYGSYTEPRALGAGGGGSINSGGVVGAGGGAAAIEGTEDTRFIIAGSIRADGVTGPPLNGGGAGGSVLLRAADIVLSPVGRVTANGGGSIPGGGGRIALYATRTLTMPDDTVQAHGGWNNNGEGPSFADGGAGTIYVVRPGETEGELRASSFDEDHASTTHISLPTPVGTGATEEMVFGSIFVGPRALVRMDAAYRVTKTDGVTVDPTGMLVGPEVQPAVSFTTTPAAGGNVWQNAPIALVYNASAGDGVADVRIIVPGRADQNEHFGTFPATVGPTTVNFNIPANAPAGPITITVSVTTRSGRTTQTTSTYTVVSDAPPQVQFVTVTPSTDVYPGTTISVSGSATDDVAVTSLNLTASTGSVNAQTATKPTPQSMARDFSVVLPKTATGGTNVLLSLSASDGFPGRAAATETRSIGILHDTVAPTASITLPTAGQEYNEVANGTFTIEVNATDAEVGVNTVKATFEGVQYTLQPIGGQPGGYSVANVPIPSVDGTEVVEKTISVAVTDFEPNTTTKSVTILIHPLVDPNAPKLSWLCSSPNAMYPASYAAPLRVIALPASTQNGVNRVEYSIDGAAPIAMTVSGTTYSGTITVPPTAVAGTVLNVRVAAFSTSGAEATLFGTITVVAGNDITTARAVSATDLSLENSTVIVRSGGVLTVTGPHTFTNLVVLDGGKVVQKHLDLGNGDQLTIDRVYIACNGSIDVTAQGYAPRTTYPGERAAATNGAAQHIGNAGWRADGGTTYGSIYRPREAGAGEYNRAFGGGVVRIASSRFTLDGAIYANGQANSTNYEGGAAGGSVWITTASMRGAGRIEANGGNGAAFSSTNAGAGAIAVEYTDGASTLPTLQARSGNHYNPYGGAGSIYTKGPQSTYGDVRFDNTAIPVEAPAELPAFGTAVVQSVPTPNTIVLSAPASVKPYFAGHWLRVQAPDGTVRGLWRIATVTSTTQVTLEEGSTPIDVRAGDTVRGAYRFDSLKLVNAWVRTPDLVLVGTTPVLDATSQLYTGNDAAPVVNTALTSFAMGTYGPLLVGAANAVTDPDKPIDVWARSTARPALADEMTPSGVTFGTVGGFSVRKIVNGQLWSSVIAKRASTTAGYISCRPSQTNLHMGCGLNSGGTHSYDFGIFNNGTYQIWIDGAPSGGTTSYNTSTVFRMERSAGTVRWYVNGSKIREQASDASPMYPFISIRDDGAELNSVHFSSDSATPWRTTASSDGSFTLGVEGAPGDSILVTARDNHYYTMTSEVVVGTIPADMTVTSVAFNPTPVTGGRTAIGTVTLGRAAPTGGAIVQLTSDTASAIVPTSVTIPAGQTSATFNVTTTPVSTPVNAIIAATYGGNPTNGVLALVRDNVNPAVTITLPVAGTQYTEGSSSGIALQATIIEEDSGVAQAYATLDGVTTNLTKNIAKGPNVWTATLPVPFVDETTNVAKDIVVTAVDNNTNSGTATVSVTIKPVSDVNAPTLAWTCFSSGGMYPAGDAVTLRVTATPPNSTNTIQNVQFFITDPSGTTTAYPAPKVTGNDYQYLYTIPAVADGASFSVRALATTVGGSTAELTRSFIAVTDAVKITTSTAIAANNTTYDGKTVVVSAGTTTIAGPHPFKRLIVLSGATVIHAVGDRLDLQPTGGVFVACGGAIDATGKGYLNAATYPGESSAGNATGGSHIGRGGLYDGPYGSTYGSVYRPQEAGAASGTGPSGAGGGIVRISTPTVVVDGVIRADGTDSDRSGAGGSVWIASTRITGNGTISTNGGRGYYGLGGGGTLAIEYTDPSSVLPTLASRTGTNRGENRLGGAGSIYVKGATSTYGDLTIDNGGTNKQPTILPSLGRGLAQPGTQVTATGATLVTDRAKDIPAFYEGHWVEIYAPDGALRGTWRISAPPSVKTVTLASNAGETIDLQPGDTWQGVYRFDNMTANGIRVESPDPIRISGTQTIEGTVEMEQVTATKLVVNGTLTHAVGMGLVINANEVRVNVNGAIDVTGKGYTGAATYPGESSAGNATGGSHIGRGGLYDGPYGSTYGSVYRPREAGAASGTGPSGPGGGTVRINAPNVIVDGEIRADGTDSDRSGAGGSVWITSTRISGSGTISTNGGRGYYGLGGGGALSIEYSDPTSVLPSLFSKTGTNRGENRLGGAGSIYVKGATSTYGDLTIDNGGSNKQPTILPSLGSGLAQPGTQITANGATLVTDRAKNIPAYFEGHWIEIYAPDGTLKGTWRISAPPSLKTVTLASNAGEIVNVQSGDTWQGVYRFDNLREVGIRVESLDPIRVTETQTLESNVETEAITATKLVVKGTLTHAVGMSLTIDANEVRVETGGSIDVTGKGYSSGAATYPAESSAGNATGGSHIGRGGLYDGPYGSTYGSVYRPREAGAASGTSPSGAGGGIVRIDAPIVVVNGTIRADGTDSDRSGAGGSVWITSTRISGNGIISTNGGRGYYGLGGGGALSIEYSDPTSVLPSLLSRTGTNRGENRLGGAGSIYVKGASSIYGDLTIDNGGSNKQPTILPSLGTGVAQPGTQMTATGAILVTDRAKNIPAYFEGHWVEIYTAAGTLKGTWRITGTPVQKTVTLASNEGEVVDVQPGDTWQGVYRFDNLKEVGIRVESVDPIRVSNTQTIEGTVEVEEITATKLVVNGTLTHATGAGLLIDADEVRVEVGGTIDVSGKGYASNATYPGETPSGDATGGSHIGRGGLYTNPFGSTYGSIYRPQELGAASGGNSSGVGGGVVRILAPTVLIDGAIRANGAENDRAGAGGSIWITSTRITGTGTVEANGGRAYYGIGGGGAIAIESTDPTSVLPTLLARSGTNKGENRLAGAGSIYIKRAGSVYGDLIVDNKGTNGQPTILPSLASGTAQAGTSGALVVTDRLVDIPAYFIGHWIEIKTAAGTLKGSWRIGALDGKTMTLTPNAGEIIDVQPGDAWQGVYRFDNVTLRTTKLVSNDPLRSTNAIDQGTTVIDINDGAPIFPTAKRSQIVVNSTVTADTVTGPFGAVTDLNTPIKLTVTNTRTGTQYTANANADGSFTVSVAGVAGDTFTIAATDSHTVPATSGTIAVNGTIIGFNDPSLTISPTTTVAGTTSYGTLRLGTIPQKTTEVALSRSSSIVTIPASVTFAVGENAKQFPIVTSATTGVVTITASLASSASATLNVVSSEAATLTAVTLSSTTIEGGTSVNGTVTLGAPAPAGGAVVMLASSSGSALVQQSVTVAAGATEASFPILTARVGAATSTIISATWGQSKSASLQLTPCAAMTDVVAPSSATVNTVWVEDTAPANATVSGEGTFDTTRVATGTSSLHFAPPTTAEQVRSWSFTGAAPLLVAPDDTLVFYALVNPCNPPKQLLITWKSGATEVVRTSWGEGRIDVATAHKLRGAMPAAGEWVRVQVLAKSVGINAATSLDALNVQVYGGEMWIDRIGASACTITTAPPPSFDADEVVWFDDALPAGSTVDAPTSTRNNWSWSSTQVASGTVSHVDGPQAGMHEHAFYNTTQTLALKQGDVLFTYVYLDPCNPPKEVMLNFYDGTWEHRAYWGDNAYTGWGVDGAPSRFRMGPLPELGKWVRLEVPVSFVDLDDKSIRGASFVLVDGRAWFDRAGKYSRVNLALNKPATQNTQYSNYVAAWANDGNLSTFNHGNMGTYPWLEIDLGSVQPIEHVQIWNRTDCCTERLTHNYILVSDKPFNTTDLSIDQSAGESKFHWAGSTSGLGMLTYTVNRAGRYVRLQLYPTNYLHVRELQVWAPAASKRINVAGGRPTLQSSVFDDWTYSSFGVDGHYNSKYHENASVFRTGTGAESSWDVNLGKITSISTIDLFNRFDGGLDNLTDFYVFFSDVPFSGATVASSLAQANVTALYYGPGAFNTQSLYVNRTAQYVRIQKRTAGELSFSEVQIWSQRNALGALSRPVDTH